MHTNYIIFNMRKVENKSDLVPDGSLALVESADRVDDDFNIVETLDIVVNVLVDLGDPLEGCDGIVGTENILVW